MPRPQSAGACFYPKNTFDLADTWNNVEMMSVAYSHLSAITFDYTLKKI